MNRTPLQDVKQRFGTKEALVTELMTGIEQPEGLSRDEWKRRLLKVPNRKLLKLHGAMTEVRERFGSKEALVDSICARKFQGRSVDRDYRAKLLRQSLGRLLDTHRSLERRKAA